MSHFEFDFNEDGSIHAIYKDGKPYEGGVSLESPNSVARTYFEIAIRELAAMKAEDDPDFYSSDNRSHGLQAFLMSLVGTEAFLNVYFHVAGLQIGSEAAVDLATNEKTIEHTSGATIGAQTLKQGDSHGAGSSPDISQKD